MEQQNEVFCSYGFWGLFWVLFSTFWGDDSNWFGAAKGGAVLGAVMALNLMRLGLGPVRGLVRLKGQRAATKRVLFGFK